MKILGMSAFAGMVINTLAVVTSASTDVSDTVTKNNSSVLPKTVFSSQLRAVFPMGLEGAGHSYLHRVNSYLFKKNHHLVQLSNLPINRYNIKSTMGNDVHHYRVAVQAAKAEMRQMARRGAKLLHPGTVKFVYIGQSYPSGFGPNKARKYVDVRLLAGVAEAEGVDFRVVYLRRPVKDLILADTVHRHFQDGLGDTATTNPEERYMEYMEILLTDIAVMHSFLAELDPAFVICHDYKRLGEVEQSSSIANFIAPNAEIAERLNKALIDVAIPHGAANRALPYGSEVVAARLQQKFDAFESELCSRTH